MAPAKELGRKKRDADYSNIGVAGRKTGVTLEDTGVRDVYGMEPLEGVFSSPEKSPKKRNGVPHNSTIEEEEDMDIGQSTIPEPTEVLSARKNGKVIMPPPRARSPIKTSLNSSPRRSVGLRSSPAQSPIKTTSNSSPRRSIGPMSSPPRQNDNTLTKRASSHPLVNRRLDFSMQKPRQSIERSPQKEEPEVPSVTRRPKNSRGNKLLSVSGKGRNKAFDLSLTEDEEEDQEEEQETELVEDSVNDIQNGASIIDESDMPMHSDIANHSLIESTNGKGLNQSYEDEASNIEPSNIAHKTEGINGHSEEPNQTVKKRGRPTKASLAAAASLAKSSNAEAQNAFKAKKPLRNAKAAPEVEEEVDGSNAHIESEKKVDESDAAIEVEEPVSPVVKKSRGRKKANPAGEKEALTQENSRPPKRKEREPSNGAQESDNPQQMAEAECGKSKKAQMEVLRDEDNGVEPEPSKPAKRPKLTAAKDTTQNGKRKNTKPPPSERDPNARITSTKKPKAKVKASSEEDGKLSMPVRNKPGPRSLYVSRTETPAADSGARVTRFGRTVVEPLKFWRNERVVWGEARLEGKTLSLPAIKEVIRTDEIVVEQKRRRAQSRPKRRPAEDVEEEEDENQEDWEQDPGILPADVVQWNPQHRRGDPETIEEIELAYAPIALQSNTREVRGADFRYAKILTLPFFGSGMVDIPPGGEKRVKNARRMQMVFFVFTGRVTVDVAGTQFSIGRGGMWQVPRGNFYAIANPATDKPARIFFAQGCDVSELEPISESNQGGGGGGGGAEA